MNSDGTTNKGKIWGLAAIAGVIAFFVLKIFASYAFWPALLLAILIAILVAILLWIGFYRDSDDGGISGGAIAAGGAALGAAGTVAATTASGASSTAANLTGEAKSAPAKKPAAKKPAAKAKSKTAAKTGTSKATTTRKTAAKPKTTSTRKKPAAKKPAAKKTGAGAKTTASSLMGDAGNAMVSAKKAEKAKTTRKPVAKDGKPPLLKKARASGADDLKQIKGVGPGLEKTLNELGFYHFDQVSGWRAKEVEWVDSRLKFKGRIVRDGWVKQCKTLAKGGATEFSKRVKKGGVY